MGQLGAALPSAGHAVTTRVRLVGGLDDFVSSAWQKLDSADLARQVAMAHPDGAGVVTGSSAAAAHAQKAQCGLGEFWSVAAAYVTCAKCSPGRYKRTFDRARCAMCPLGKYQSASGATGCLWCASGRFQNRFGMAECRLCPHGTFLPYEWHYRLTRSECIKCEQGKTSTSDRKSCYRPAWLQRRTDLTASPTPVPSPHAPQPAPTPYPTPHATASPTPAAPIASLHAHLESCLPGSLLLQPGGSLGKGGKAATAARCQKCAVGRFQPRLDGMSCGTCPNGMRAEPSRVSCFTSTTVTSTQHCPAGTCWVVVETKMKMHREWLLQCRTCEPGMFQPMAGQNSCRYCPHGKFSDATSFVRTSCLTCPAGQFQASFGQTFCHKCPFGKYQPWMNRLAARSSCHACPVGRASALDRKSCVLAHYSYGVSPYLCRAGTFWVRPAHSADTACAACPRGKFQPRASQRACRVCPAGQTTSRGATARCVPPPRAPPRAPQCVAGRYGRPGSDRGAVPCKVCPAGKYQANAGVEECWKCPKGEVSTDSRTGCHKITKLWSMHKGAYGASREHPAPSCLSVLLTTPHAVDGYYWLVLPSGRAINAYCLMSEGGWTRIAHATGPARAPMQRSAWRPLLGSDYFLSKAAAARSQQAAAEPQVTASTGARVDGFPNLDDFAFAAPLATFADVPFREVLLHDGKRFLPQKTHGEHITTMREVMEQEDKSSGSGSGVLSLYQVGELSGFLHLQGAANQRGRTNCFFPTPDGGRCAKWAPGDGGDETTSFHVANTAACRGWAMSKAHDKEEDSLLWGGTLLVGAYAAMPWLSPSPPPPTSLLPLSSLLLLLLLLLLPLSHLHTILL